MQEKKQYEQSVKMNEMAELLKEQQIQIAERDETISILRNNQSLELSQKQLEEKSNTFVG